MQKIIIKSTDTNQNTQMVEQAPKPTIGWIGTGVMGKSMAMHLKNKGYTLYVHTRSAEKAQDLVAAGAVMLAP